MRFNEHETCQFRYRTRRNQCTNQIGGSLMRSRPGEGGGSPHGPLTPRHDRVACIQTDDLGWRKT